jgi:tartrate-resistant acid phosphatase type 5
MSNRPRLIPPGWGIFSLALLLLTSCTVFQPPSVIPESGPDVTSTPSLAPLQLGSTDTPFPAASDTPLAIPTEPSAILQVGLSPTATSPPSPTPLPTATPTEVPIRFAVIGDFGTGNSYAEAVADLVKSWDPDFIITTGDNNYPNGEWETIDNNIGKFYIDFIKTNESKYGKGADTNRFFPSLGNHDWDTQDKDSNGPRPYLRYFHDLPGNKRYYDFVEGPVHFFAIDSDWREPDGVSTTSKQATWLKEKLAASQSRWKVVFFHATPFSSGKHGGTKWMDWPFQEWGASIVMAGHDHTYERIEIDGFTYIVNGLGGAGRYLFKTPIEGSQVRFRDKHGAMLVEATSEWMISKFYTRDEELIDTFQLGTLNPITLDLEPKLFVPLLHRAGVGVD